MYGPCWAVLHMHVPHDVRHVEFRGVTGSQRTPRFWGVTGTETNLRTKGTGLDQKEALENQRSHTTSP